MNFIPFKSIPFLFPKLKPEMINTIIFAKDDKFQIISCSCIYQQGNSFFIVVDTDKQEILDSLEEVFCGKRKGIIISRNNRFDKVPVIKTV